MKLTIKLSTAVVLAVASASAATYTGTDNISAPSDSLSTNTLQSYNRNLLRRAVENFVISKFTAKKAQPKFMIRSQLLRSLLLFLLMV